MSLPYETRVRLTALAVNNFLSRYTRPTNLTHALAAEEIRLISEDVNALLPNMDDEAQFTRWVDAGMDHLRRTYRSRSWPTSAHFIEAVTAMCKQRIGREEQERAATGGASGGYDPVEINAARMNVGQAVGDQWLYGRQSVALMATGLVSAETLKKYRSALFLTEKEALGHEEAIRLERQRIDHHAACAAETAI